MDSTLTKDARGFVDGVVTMLRSTDKTKTMAPKVQTLLDKMTAQSKRERLAKVETSIPLSPEEKKSLEEALTHALEREVMLEVAVKPELIGGFRVQVGDWVYDTSLTGQLHQMAEQLVEGMYE